MPCLPTSRRLHLKMRCSTHFLSRISFHLLSACDLTGTPFPPCRHQSQQHRDCSEYVRALVFNSMLVKFLKWSCGRFISRYLSKGISQHTCDFCEHRPSRDLHNYPRSVGYHGNMWYFFFSHIHQEKKSTFIGVLFSQPCSPQTLPQANPVLPPVLPGDPAVEKHRVTPVDSHSSQVNMEIWK